MRKSGMDETWLEPLLRQHLQRVSAPKNLRPREPVVRRSGQPWVWILATAASLLAVAWGYYPHQRELRSSSAAEIRAWVESRTGLQVPITPDSSVQMRGARIVDGKAQTVEVHYDAGNQSAVLLIAKAASNLTSPHAAIDRRAAAKEVSWTMAGQTYKLSSAHSNGLHAACLVCHTESRL